MTAVSSQITDKVVLDCITKSVQSVFRTMMHRETTLVATPTVEALAGTFAEPHVLASVGFLGSVDGLIYLGVAEDYAKTLSCQMLGMTLAELNSAGMEVVHDALGEIANMTVGGFKNTFCDMGFPCKLTVPAIIRGNHLSIATIKSARRNIFQFDSGPQRLVVDIQIKMD